MTNQTNKSATPKPAEFMSDKTRAFVEPVRKMLAEGINVQATGEATNRIVEGAFRSLVEHIDELEMDLAALRTAVALASPALAAFLREAVSPWIKITSAEVLPKKPGLKSYEYVDCLIFHNGEIKKRPWNCEHLCWDDEEYDDFYCDALEPTYYMRLPAPPTEAATLSQETRNDD